jgi:GntR family transcriptional repressor for pyruvate dehydrogenase complex
MRSLAFVGAVQTRQGSGTFVCVPEGRTVERLISLYLSVERCKVREVIVVWRMLEVESSRMAALNHDENNRRALEAVMAEMADSVADGPKAYERDVQFHIILGRASHNTVLSSLINGMRSFLEIWMKTVSTQEQANRQVIEEIVKENNAVLRAVVARDPERAAAFMSAHLSNAADRLFAVFGKEQSMTNYFSLLRDSSFAQRLPC